MERWRDSTAGCHLQGHAEVGGRWVLGGGPLRGQPFSHTRVCFCRRNLTALLGGTEEILNYEQTKEVQAGNKNQPQAEWPCTGGAPTQGTAPCRRRPLATSWLHMCSLMHSFTVVLGRPRLPSGSSQASAGADSKRKHRKKCLITNEKCEEGKEPGQLPGPVKHSHYLLTREMAPDPHPWWLFLSLGL